MSRLCKPQKPTVYVDMLKNKKKARKQSVDLVSRWVGGTTILQVLGPHPRPVSSPSLLVLGHSGAHVLNNKQQQGNRKLADSHLTGVSGSPVLLSFKVSKPHGPGDMCVRVSSSVSAKAISCGRVIQVGLTRPSAKRNEAGQMSQ